MSASLRHGACFPGGGGGGGGREAHRDTTQEADTDWRTRLQTNYGYVSGLARRACLRASVVRVRVRARLGGGCGPGMKSGPDRGGLDFCVLSVSYVTAQHR